MSISNQQRSVSVVQQQNVNVYKCDLCGVESTEPAGWVEVRWLNSFNVPPTSDKVKHYCPASSNVMVTP